MFTHTWWGMVNMIIIMFIVIIVIDTHVCIYIYVGKLLF